MFEKYKAAREDFEAIEEGIKISRKKELNFIFSGKKLLDKTTIISFDSQFIYLWSTQKFTGLKFESTSLPEYHFFRILHKVPILDKDYSTWCASVPKKEFLKFLPKSFTLKSQFSHPRIGGGFLTPFICIHQKMKNEKIYPFDPYTTKESFLATIIHEFAHVYYNQHKLWWFSDKKQNLNYIKNAIKLLEDEKTIVNTLKIAIPYPLLFSEIFAFCTEYYSANLFWPTHKRNLNKITSEILKKILPVEIKKNYHQEDSLFNKENLSHIGAAVLGRIILQKYPTLWPKVLLKRMFL